MTNIQKFSQSLDILSLPNEIWKDIPEYEGSYKVSNIGRVFSLKSNKILTPSISNGYDRIELYKEGRVKIGAHRLLALAFIPNSENKPQVNHINGIRNDNRLENLEWVTPKENIQHSLKLGGMKEFHEKERKKEKPFAHLWDFYRKKGKENHSSKPVKAHNTETKEEISFGSRKEASRILEVSHTAIRKAIKRNHKCKGYYLSNITI